MNAHARFVCMSMGGPGNAAGAENVLTWQTGYPFAVSLGRGYPRFGPRDYTAADVLERGECDAALIVADDPKSAFDARRPESTWIAFPRSSCDSRRRRRPPQSRRSRSAPRLTESTLRERSIVPMVCRSRCVPCCVAIAER